MLGYLFEKTTSVVSTTYDLVADTVDYVVEDVKSIPQSIEDGWNNPLIGDSKQFTDVVDEVVSTTKKFGSK